MKVCVSLIEENVKDAVAAGLAAQEGGADLLEVRFDRMAKLPEDLSPFRRLTVPRIATLRTVQQGGACQLGDEERLRFFRRAVRIGFEYLDIEDDSPLVRRMGRELKNTGVICSHHDFAGTPPLSGILDALVGTASRGDVAKVAFQVNGVGDLARLHEAARMFSVTGNHFVMIGMGPLGEVTRVLPAAFGSAFTYASLEQGKEAAPGQVDLVTLKALGDKPIITGLTGNPLGHSASPAMHDRAFRALGIPGRYLLLPAQDQEVEVLMDLVRDLNLRGLNVTIPHKASVMPYLDSIDPLAERVGAVNVIVNHSGRLEGRNTDVTGLEKALLSADADPRGKDVLVIGAGGAARACCAVLERRGARIWVTDRTASRAQELAKRFLGRAAGHGEVTSVGFDMVINCTPLGMKGFPDELPVDPSVFRPGQWAVDLVYNPLVTRFLAEAGGRGAKTLSGMEMLIYQAMDAFEAWTGQRPPYEVMAEGARTG
ncbi:MAG: shikimate dehydrogenase [Methanomassiliicoccus sp.]|nr:shikimate dehydrogenase [Methanomassiliicoccus sp.]